MASSKGEKFQVYFHYERLPVFCFLNGVMGHDDQHCTYPARQTDEPPQYGDWLRTEEGNKMGSQNNDLVKTTATQYTIQNPMAMRQNASSERA
nr:hypothetical protein CFP56_44782 [Quercus suber]